jgi:hypothetical protein
MQVVVAMISSIRWRESVLGDEAIINASGVLSSKSEKKLSLDLLVRSIHISIYFLECNGWKNAENEVMNKDLDTTNFHFSIEIDEAHA